MFPAGWQKKIQWIMLFALFAFWIAPSDKVIGKLMVLDPGEMGPCEYEKISLDIEGIQTAIFIPVDGSCDARGKAPFPGLVFAHGFTMMGFSDGVAEVEGHGEHLASWGYWVAIPALPDDAETRIADYRSVIDFLLHATNQASSPVYQKIDPQRLAAAGYSLGGSTALAASARDDRIQTAIALDPVYHEGGFSGEGDPIWNPEVEGIMIEIPTGILGSPANSCNSQADYAEIYDFLGSVHKAAYQVTGASHCDFLDPANSYCTLFCGGTSDASRTALSQRYMTAWLNYYLYLENEYYSRLFGDGLQQDIAQNSISVEYANHPRNFQGYGTTQWAVLTWERYDHPVLGGYNIYRRASNGVYPYLPYRQLALTGSFADPIDNLGEPNGYKVCSYDKGGNEHQCSAEIIIAAGESEPSHLPIIFR